MVLEINVGDKNTTEQQYKGKCHGGIAKQNLNLQNVKYSWTFLSTNKTSAEVLYPALGPTLEERCGLS